MEYCSAIKHMGGYINTNNINVIKLANANEDQNVIFPAI